MFSILVALFLQGPAHARDLLRVDLLAIRPTQGYIGVEWAKEKKEKFARLSAKQMSDYLRKEAPPAVLGPEGTVYLLDNHHEFYAMVSIGIREGFVDIVADFSGDSSYKFFKRMKRRKWLYLGNDRGQFRNSLAALPKTLTGLRDDPYRTLSSRLKRAGGYDKMKRPHFEFIWANALRKVIPLEVLLASPGLALELALTFAASADAAHLPGYAGRHKASGCEHWLR